MNQWSVRLCEWDSNTQTWNPMACHIPVAWNCDEGEAKDKARRLNRAFQHIFDVWYDVGEVERSYRAVKQSEVVAGV